MWNIAPPALETEAVFRACVSRALLPARARLLSCVPDVKQASARYETAAVEASCHLLQRRDFRTPLVDSTELKKTYTSRMVPLDSPGRTFYDELRMSAPDNICPLCGHRDVSTLDHYLPKNYFPLVAVDPLNLVPVCAECNRGKAEYFPSSQAELPLNPYFDDVDSALWLRARVIEDTPPAAIFYVSDPGSWDPLTVRRVQTHFKARRLGSLYAAQAAVTMRSNELLFERAYRRGGREAVRESVSDLAAGFRSTRNNTWQSALYDALADSDWYCDGGFRTGV